MSARTVALALFLLSQGLFLLTASGRVDRVPDEYEVYQQAFSLVERGTLAMPPELPDAAFFGRVGRGGARYAPYGPGVAFLVLPHHLLGRGLATAAGVERAQTPVAWHELVAGVTSLATTTWGALAVALTSLLATGLGATPRRAAAVAASLGGATLLWHYGTVFYSEAIGAALLAAALLGVQRRWPLLTAGATFALVLLKASAVILLIAPLALALAGDGDLRVRARRAFPIAASGALALAVHLAWNVHRFGDPAEFGYDWSELLSPGAPPRAFTLWMLARGLPGLLVSPGKSLFLFAPPVALAALALPRAWRLAPPLVVAWGASLVAALLYYGSFRYWEGGYAFGPRHFVPLLPLLVLPLACGAAPRRAAWLACVALGAAGQLLGVLISPLEDQALGHPARPPGNAYYAIHAPDSGVVPPGLPLNVYRLDYEPWTRYVRRLAGHLTADERDPYVGIDLFPLHVERVRLRPGGEALPRWPALLLTLGLGGLSLALGATALRSGLKAEPPPGGAP